MVMGYRERGPEETGDAGSKTRPWGCMELGPCWTEEKAHEFTGGITKHINARIFERKKVVGGKPL